MSVVYSTRFLGGRYASGSQPSYQVPASHVVVIRSISLYNVGAVTTSFVVFINGAWNLAAWGGIPAQGSAQLDTHQVLNPGDTIQATSTSTQFDVTISGYLLSL